MLVLTRKLEESIIIENNIEVKILKIQGNQVHIGISAPKHISIYRDEIYQQVKEENQSAVQTFAENAKFERLEKDLDAFRKLIHENKEEK